VRPGDLLARAALLSLRKLVKARRVEILVGAPLVLELLGMRRKDKAAYAVTMKEMMRLAGYRLLLNPDERKQWEVQLGRRLRAREMFSPRWKRDNVGWLFNDDQSLTDDDAMIQKAKAEFGQDEIENKKAIAAVGEQREFEDFKKRWRRSPDEMIEGWCWDWMRTNADALGLVGDERGWPHPKRCPTLWAWHAYHMAYIYMVALEGRGPSKVDPNHLLDRAHFADAVYGDMLVTDDGYFHQISHEARFDAVRLVKFDRWAAAIARTRPTLEVI
jgi:hypothetical protein